MGVVTLIGIAVATIAALLWEHRNTRHETGSSWAGRYSVDRSEDFALRHSPSWQEERRRQRAALEDVPAQEQPTDREKG